MLDTEELVCLLSESLSALIDQPSLCPSAWEKQFFGLRRHVQLEPDHMLSTRILESAVHIILSSLPGPSWSLSPSSSFPRVQF